MFAFGPKALTIIAATMSLSYGVWGCLNLQGHVQDGFAVEGFITATDNGDVTCDGDITSGDNNVGTSQEPTTLLTYP
jgi:hypothetical protein